MVTGRIAKKIFRRRRSRFTALTSELSSGSNHYLATSLPCRRAAPHGGGGGGTAPSTHFSSSSSARLRRSTQITTTFARSASSRRFYTAARPRRPRDLERIESARTAGHPLLPTPRRAARQHHTHKTDGEWGFVARSRSSTKRVPHPDSVDCRFANISAKLSLVSVAAPVFARPSASHDTTLATSAAGAALHGTKRLSRSIRLEKVDAYPPSIYYQTR